MVQRRGEGRGGGGGGGGVGAAEAELCAAGKYEDPATFPLLDNVFLPAKLAPRGSGGGLRGPRRFRALPSVRLPQLTPPWLPSLPSSHIS